MIVLLLLAFAGCVLGAVGVFQPWLLESGDVVQAGISTIDGIIALVVSIVAAGWIVYTIIARQTRYWYVTAVAGFALSLIGYTTFSDLRTFVTALSETDGYVWSVGLGPYFTAGGGVITLVCGGLVGWIHNVRRRATPHS